MKEKRKMKSYEMKCEKTVALFMTNSMGLWDWHRVGSLSREIAVYRRLREDGWKVSFYTYDRGRVLPQMNFQAKIITQWPFVVPRRLSFLYGVVVSILRYKEGRENSLVVTNQAHSGWPAVLAGRLWNSKVLARCGYVLGERAENEKKRGLITNFRRIVEKLTFKYSDLCAVPTHQLAKWINKNYSISQDKIRVLPNYVDTRLFAPDEGLEKATDVLYVGRLAEVKRPCLILESTRNTNWRVRLVGNGSLVVKLKDFASSNGVNLEIIKMVPNENLPRFYNDSRVFVLTSKCEGHPKTLIEAMACGCACVCTKSPGLTNLIVHGKTGLIVDPTPHDIGEAINKLLEDEKFRKWIGKNAREYAVQHFSLDRVHEMYKEILEELLQDEPR